MPAPTQVPPFLAAVLGPQALDDANHDKSAAAAAVSAERPALLASSSSSYAVVNERAAEKAPTTATTAAFDDDEADWLTSSVLPTLLVPPLNFDMVSASRSNHGGTLYRSGFPNERNFPFLNTLHLRTVVYLSADDVRPNLQRWIDGSRGRTTLLHFRLNVNKEPFAEMDEDVVTDALCAILDMRNMPMLIHCNKGKYRVGVVTALVRRLQGWSMTSVYDEYARFAGSDRIADEEFIDMFPVSRVRKALGNAPDWLPV